MPSISFIVARSFPGNVIGYENRLPWRLKSDLKKFREITTGHVVIMGRATFESVGRPLPNRTNIVLSRNPALTDSREIDFDEGTQLTWTNTLEDALLTADIISICRQKSDIFVIGGETMYTLFGELVNKVFLTEVFAEVPGDSHFAAKFPRKQWKLIVEQDFRKNRDGGDDHSYKFSIRERRERRNRYGFVSRFFSERLEKNEWLSSQVKRHKSELIEYVQEHLEVYQDN